jgi:penicillin-binding protein 2
LAENRPAFALSISAADLKKPSSFIDRWAGLLDMTPEQARSYVEKSAAGPAFVSYPVKRNLTFEETARFMAEAPDASGLEFELKPARRYPAGETLCHVLGTVGEISGRELAAHFQAGDYRPGDSIGKSGLELEYESLLRGTVGWERIEIDAKGRRLRTLDLKQPKAGVDLELTIDMDFQRFVEDAFTERAGAAIAMDPDTGRILAVVSKPGFDLGLFSPHISARQWKALVDDPSHPLENRAVRGLYPPASTFKIVTAIAALQEGLVTPQETFVCKGALELGGQKFRCWNSYGHGKVDLRRAIVESCDVYFYELGLRLGPEKLARYASLFGFGRPTGVKLPQEAPGLVPSAPWKRRAYDLPWKDGDTINMAIGQGYMTATPLQIALMTSVAANGGKLIKPTILQRIRDADGATLFAHTPQVVHEPAVASEHFRLLRSAMIQVTAAKAGTGKRCRIPGLNVAGKTGTSQVIRHIRKTEEGAEVPYHERAHAIFTAYVDSRPKKLAVTVVVEHGGGGGQSAAPIARKIICKYYGIADPGDPKE